jgi:manganese transport protein
MTEILERPTAVPMPAPITFATTSSTPIGATAFVSPLQAILDRGRVRAIVAMLGPAFIAAIAYVDPGNFATNFQGGALFGYRLMWVVAAANVIAIPIQYLSAKLGIVTGKSLPQLCGDLLPRPVAAALWVQAEIVAMATDLAEFVGAAVGLNLLFHMPLPIAGATTGVLAFAVLSLQRRGYRSFEVAIGALLSLIILGFLYETLRIGPSASASVGGLLPRLQGHESLLIASAIIGATVMPHAIYLHSGLTSNRIQGHNARERRHLLRFERTDVIVALGLAGLVNMGMLAIAAKLFHHAGTGVADTSLFAVHEHLAIAVGGGAALIFAVALLSSGISSSSVGTCAGQIVMDGFIHRRIPATLRRLITMAPALALLCTHVDPTRALVGSQVVLSFGIPFALIPLTILTARKRLMGEHVNSIATTATMTVVSVGLTALNVWLLIQQFSG